MKKYSFVKMNGAGNDFIVFDKNIAAGLELSPSLIQKLCDRRLGIGGDGVITIAIPVAIGTHDFEMEYFNADGTTGTLCGNGARCAIQFADLFGISRSKSPKFFSNGIEYSGEVLETGLIKFNLNSPDSLKENLLLAVSGYEISANFINTGSPHVVVFLDDPAVMKNIDFGSLNDFPVYSVGKEIRYSKMFAPEGTNVNFIEIENSLVHIRTYERGVEDETLACGTGSVASAIVTFLQKQIPPPIVLQTKGGDELTVDFLVEGKLIKNVSLTGPAKINFTGEFTL